jgi:hypothetical protein
LANDRTGGHRTCVVRKYGSLLANKSVFSFSVFDCLRNPDSRSSDSQKNYSHFMQSEGSLPSSQEPTTFTLHIRNQINSERLLSLYFFTIEFNIILPFTPRSSNWSLSFTFSHQHSVCISIPPCVHIPSPPQPSSVNLSEDYKS